MSNVAVAVKFNGTPLATFFVDEIFNDATDELTDDLDQWCMENCTQDSSDDDGTYTAWVDGKLKATNEWVAKDVAFEMNDLNFGK